MPCYHPLPGYRSRTVNPTGKRSIVFNKKDGYSDLPVELPCGQCIGCRLERSRQWAIRCVHESKLHEENAFITLTYNEENVPEHGTLVLAHFQNFMKRLRQQYKNRKIRFFHCGEYGENTNRPHYHACIFGFDFPDKKHWSTVNGEKYYRSKILETLWPAGNSMIGNVTFESAAYVARYICKKWTGEKAEDYYDGRKPEYTSMSLKPGIGRTWYEKNKKEVYPSDFIIIRGVKMRPPKYYDGRYEIENQRGIKKIKEIRKEKGKKFKEQGGAKRLETREEIQIERWKKLKRGYENQ